MLIENEVPWIKVTSEFKPLTNYMFVCDFEVDSNTAAYSSCLKC